MPSWIKSLWGISLLCVTLSTAAQSEANSSGTWVLNRTKSDFPRFGNLNEGRNASLTMTVEQQDQTLRVTRDFDVDSEKSEEAHTYRTDGTETTNTGLRGKPVVNKAHWQRNKLVVGAARKVSMLVRDVTVASRGVWSLSPAGKILTIDGVVHSPRGERPMRAAFDQR